MMFQALQNETAQLPEVKINDYKNFIGNSTKSSIASGVINSALGMINQTINYLKGKNKKSKILIYVTGGNAEFILPHFKFNYVYEKGLVLYGIKAVYENTIKN
jgi:type III pantothenate kinase